MGIEPRKLIESINKSLYDELTLKRYKKHFKEMLINLETMTAEQLTSMYGEQATYTDKKDIEFIIDYINLALKYLKKV